MSLKISLQVYDASPKNTVDLPDLENRRVQSKGRTTYLLHSCFFCTENSLYAYSLKDLYSAATGMEIKLPSLQQDPQWEKNIDSTTHRLSLLRCQFVLVAGGVEGTGVPDKMALFFPGYMAFGLGAHLRLRESAGVDGWVRVSQERRESRLGFPICIYCAGEKKPNQDKNQNPAINPSSV